MTLDEIQNAVIQGKPRLAEKLVEEALENGADSAEILARGLLGGMQQIGLRFGDDRDVARALASSRAMKAGLEKLKPFLEQGVRGNRGRVLIGTAGGDLHDVEKTSSALLCAARDLRFWIWGWMCPRSSLWTRSGRIRRWTLSVFLRF